MNWPGRCGVSARPSAGSNSRERTSAVSGVTAATVNGRNPLQAGGSGTAPVRPLLPARPACTCSSRLRNECFQPSGQRRDGQRPPQRVAVVLAAVEEIGDLLDAESLRPVGDLDDRVAGADLALLDHAQVEARAAVPGQQRGHPRLLEADADLVTGDPRLRDLEHRGADREPVADAHVRVGQPATVKFSPNVPMRRAASGPARAPSGGRPRPGRRKRRGARRRARRGRPARRRRR